MAENIAQTATNTRRLPALDVLRGIAILGTLMANIWIFAYGGAGLAAMSKTSLQSQLAGLAAETEVAVSPLQQVGNSIDFGLSLLTDGKFIGLLTIMFGIGLEIQRQSALRRGDKWPGRYPWRAALLILDGLLNYIFIFEYDVLMGYGLTALVVAAVLARNPKTQKIWMIVGVAVHVALMVGALLATWWVVNYGAEDESTAIAADDPVFTDTGSYVAQVQSRLEHFWLGRAEIPIMFFMGIGLFLVGAHLFRAGIFEPRGAKLRKWVLLGAFGLGLPLDWYLRIAHPEITASFTRYVTSAIVALGILALVAGIYVHRAAAGKSSTGRIGTAFALVGRMALTNYILQNLIASIIFYDWGFGVAAKIQGEAFAFWVLGCYVLIAGLLLLFSWAWLRKFQRGPVEELWHRSYTAIGERSERHAVRREARRAERRAQQRL
ncbi:DUF418 domain-containing protein [Canibacter oris]|uniref:DUF418 domain-containing protein n=1 Tax=Canibacter oris TaxID=1365628 RepID=A0A840DI76_9MICO|nr:DUF418 domain-containing protein [Canibacter oris]MBB4071423.1 uncharacterized protein [Canibacter oris]